MSDSFSLVQDDKRAQMTEDKLTDRLQLFVGRHTSAPVVARDAVNVPMIRHWCDAMGDTNPVYTDPEAAAASRHEGIVAPPAMVQCWTMQGLIPRQASSPDGQAGQFSSEDGQAELFALLDEAGFTSVVATNSDERYTRYLRPGDLLTLNATYESVSPLKRTALGDGYFISSLQEWHDQDGDLVASTHIRVLKFRPKTVSESPASVSAPPAAVVQGGGAGRREALRVQEFVGEALADLVIEITPTLIIATAIATRDYQDVHHDRDLARQRGSKDIFMNILTTSGLLQRYVTEWAGSEALVRRISLRLGAPNYPYDTMVLRGRVSSIEANESGRIVEVETVGSNSIGDHVLGTVTVQMSR